MVQIIGAPDISNQLQPLLKGLNSLAVGFGESISNSRLRAQLLGQGFTAEQAEQVIGTDKKERGKLVSRFQDQANQTVIDKIVGEEVPEDNFKLIEEDQAVIDPQFSKQLQINENLKAGRDPFDGLDQVSNEVKIPLQDRASQFGLKFNDDSAISARYDRAIAQSSKEWRSLDTKRRGQEAKIELLEQRPQSEGRDKAIERLTKERDKVQERQDKIQVGTPAEQKEMAEIQSKAVGARQELKILEEAFPLLQEASANSGQDIASLASRLIRGERIYLGLTTEKEEQLQALANLSVIRAVKPLPRIEKEFQSIIKTRPNVYNTEAGNRAVLEFNLKNAALDVERANLANQLINQGVPPREIHQLTEKMLEERSQIIFNEFKTDIENLDAQGLDQGQVTELFR